MSSILILVVGESPPFPSVMAKHWYHRGLESLKSWNPGWAVWLPNLYWAMCPLHLSVHLLLSCYFMVPAEFWLWRKCC